MRFFYFLHFTSDAGHVGQLALHVPTGKIYSRTSYQGQPFSPWRRLDVERRTDGSLNEVVHETVRAQNADVAGRLRQPMRITFVGDVLGSVAFDGSENVVCQMTLLAAGGGESGGGASEETLIKLEERVARLEEAMDYFHNSRPN